MLELLQSHLSQFVERMTTEIKGTVFVEEEESGVAILQPDGALIVGPLNPPLPYHYLKFKGSEVAGRQDIYSEDEKWEIVPEEWVIDGLHMLLLIDPRTYLPIRESLQGDEFPKGDGITALVTFDVEKTFKLLDVPEIEAAWITDTLGSTYETAFEFDGDSRVDVSLVDPMPGAGHVTVRYELPNSSSAGGAANAHRIRKITLV